MDLWLDEASMEQDVRRIEGKTQETALQLQQYQEEPDPWVNSVEDPLRCEKQHWK